MNMKTLRTKLWIGLMLGMLGFISAHAETFTLAQLFGGQDFIIGETRFTGWVLDSNDSTVNPADITVDTIDDPGFPGFQINGNNKLIGDETTLVYNFTVVNTNDLPVISGAFLGLTEFNATSESQISIDLIEDGGIGLDFGVYVNDGNDTKLQNAAALNGIVPTVTFESNLKLDHRGSATVSVENYITQIILLTDPAGPMLTDLTISEGTLGPTFDSETTTYAATVPNETTSMTVTATAESGITLTLNGQAITSGVASPPQNLNVGENELEVLLTAENSTESSYTVTVTREVLPLPVLTNLTLSEGSMSPTFDSDTRIYTAPVPNENTSLTVTATADPGTTLTLNGQPITSGEASPSQNLNVGANAFEVLLTAADDSESSYTITVTRAAATGTGTFTLAQLIAGQDFTIGETRFTSWSWDSADSTVDPTLVTVSTIDNPGFPGFQINGNNELTGDEARLIYSFTVVNDSPSIAGAFLNLTGFNASPEGQINIDLTEISEFGGLILGVAVNDGNDTKLQDAGALDGLVQSVTFEGNVKLDLNEAGTIAVENYTTQIILLGGSDGPVLTDLTISEGALSPTFVSDTRDYTATVPFDTTSVSVTATADAGTALTLNGQSITSGQASPPLDLSVGENELVILLSAAGSESSYSILVTREADSSSPVLTNLTISEGTLSPTFDSDTRNYTTSVPFETTSLTVSATAEAGTTLTLNGQSITSGQASSPQDLSVGENELVILLSADTESSYSVVVTRQTEVGQSPTVEFTGNNATGIRNLNVGGILYNVEFVNNSALTVYGAFPGVFDFPSEVTLGDAATEAVNAVIAALATEPAVMTVGPDNSVIFNVGFGSFSAPIQDVPTDFVQVAQGYYFNQWKITGNPDTTFYEAVASYANFTEVGTEPPDPPTLDIAVSGSNEVTISWSPASSGFVLQESTNLVSGLWMNSPSGSNNPAVLPVDQTAKMFRLELQ
jgi:hypothetical protein